MTSPQLWPDCYGVFEIDTLRSARPRWSPEYSLVFFFFFYHPLCRPVGVDRQQPLLLNSGDAKCRWNDCTRRSAFHFAWISSSRQARAVDFARSRVIVCATDAFDSLIEISSRPSLLPPPPRLRNANRRVRRDAPTTIARSGVPSARVIRDVMSREEKKKRAGGGLSDRDPRDVSYLLFVANFTSGREISRVETRASARFIGERTARVTRALSAIRTILAE